jgi:hypothetical protein
VSPFILCNWRNENFRMPEARLQLGRLTILWHVDA